MFFWNEGDRGLCSSAGHRTCCTFKPLISAKGGRLHNGQLLFRLVLTFLLHCLYSWGIWITGGRSKAIASNNIIEASVVARTKHVLALSTSRSTMPYSRYTISNASIDKQIPILAILWGRMWELFPNGSAESRKADYFWIFVMSRESYGMILKWPRRLNAPFISAWSLGLLSSMVRLFERF